MGDGDLSHRPLIKRRNSETFDTAPRKFFGVYITMNMRRKQIAHDTLQILEHGSYQAPSGRIVSLSDSTQECLTNTRCHLPEQLDELQSRVLVQPAAFATTTLDVSNETTLQATARLSASGASTRIGVLNFASAKNPGGGFLGGAHAQEESLARSSGLYKSLLRCRAHYDFHRSQGTCLYSDRMIYSPGCPVFRKDDGTLLEQPYLVDFITSPAPNAGAIERNEPENIDKIIPTLQERSSKVLSLALSNGCDTLLLGAWGCGVFRNDPAIVADTFFSQLSEGGKFWGRFRNVLFAVLDTSASQTTFAPFAARLVA